MTFSIIIPAYNAEAFLPRCLDSIFSQEYDDYEVIVINDGSTDSTATLLKQYASKHPNLHILSQINQGMATARNRGLEEAQGDYVMFIDSDDQIAEDALKTLAGQISGEDIIEFGSSIYNEGTQTTTHFQLSSSNFQPCSGWDYFCRERLTPRPVHFVCIWQRVYRRAFLEENNLHFVDGLRRAEDDLFTTMVMLHAKTLKTIPACLYIYRIRANSITRSNDPKLDADSWHVQQILADTFIPMQGVEKQTIYQVLASNYINHLSEKGNTLTPTEWRHFREVCITPRHRRLYRLLSIHPFLFRLYENASRWRLTKWQSTKGHLPTNT